MRSILSALLILALACFAAARADDDKLGLGDHSRHPRHWRDLDRTAINILPAGILEQIRSMLPGENGDLWFSTGPTLQHIDASLHVSSITMPSTYWQVGPLARGPGGEIWFTLFNAGRIGVLRNGRIETFPIDAAERVYAYGIAVDGERNVWLSDSSEGQLDEYRSGRIARRFQIGKAYVGAPSKPTPCGGRIWFAGAAGRVGYVSGNDVKQFHVLPMGGSRYAIASLACGAGGRLWYRIDTSVGWFDRNLGQRAFLLDSEISLIAAAPDGSLIAIKSKTAPDLFYRIFPNGKIERRVLPLREFAQGGGTELSNVAVGIDGTIWLSLDVPVTIVKLVASSK